MSENSTDSTEERVIENLSSGRETKPKQVGTAKGWCFTWNNYPINWKEILVPAFAGTDGWVMAPEIAPTTGTPHIQGYVAFKTRQRPTCLKLCKDYKIWWTAAKGTPDQNSAYCSKGGEQMSGGICRTYRVNITLRAWQLEIDEILREPPNDRHIYWYWEAKGGAGKTTFQKWVYTNHKNVAVLSGKASDMKNGVIQFIEKRGCEPDIVLVNIPRCQDVDHVSWQGIEELKDMFFFSPKYEGGMVCGENPHLIIFANEHPPYHKLSTDRWVVREIKDS